MNWVFISIVTATVLEGWFCGFSSIISIIAGILFVLRFKGIVVPVKVCIGLEVAAAVILLLITFYTMKFQTPQILIFAGVKTLIYWTDDKFYVYSTEDLDESNEPETNGKS
jgi:hypothetical protein